MLGEHVGERWVYSARCSSGTAQSSMKDTGFPSPFIDIMMLRPALRTSQSSAWPGLGHLDHAAGQAEVAHQLVQPLEIAHLRLALLARELDQQDRLGLALQGALDHRRERGVGEREVDHGAIDQLHRRGPSFTMCCAASIALWKRGKCATPRALCSAMRELQVRRCVTASVPSLPTSRCARLTNVACRAARLREEDVEVVAADAAQHLGLHALDLVALGEAAPRPCRRSRAPPAACPRRAEPKRARTPSASIASIATTLSTMLP